MLLEIVVVGIIGGLMYQQSRKLMYAPTGSSKQNTESRLKEKQENGYQFRDQTFGVFKDIISHPDVINSDIAEYEKIQDLGIYGTNRYSFQAVPGVSELTQIYNTTSLKL